MITESWFWRCPGKLGLATDYRYGQTKHLAVCPSCSILRRKERFRSVCNRLLPKIILRQIGGCQKEFVLCMSYYSATLPYDIKYKNETSGIRATILTSALSGPDFKNAETLWRAHILKQMMSNVIRSNI